MANVENIFDSVLELICAAQLRAIRVFLEQARSHSKYKYLSLEFFGATLMVSGVDKACEGTVLNPFYDGTDKEK